MRNIYEGYLMVSDMDGTLLNSQGKISNENLNAIRYFRENGGEFTVATGRMVPSAQRFIDILDIKIPVILYNGSKIYNYSNNEVIYESYLESNDKEIIKEIKKKNKNLGIEIYSNETIYLYGSNLYTNRLSKKGYKVIDEVSNETWRNKWTKVLILGTYEEINILEEELREKYTDTNFIRSGERFLEICPKGDSKGNALDILLKKLNYSKEKIIAIGDNMNDLELLSKASYGFVVGNGNKQLFDRNFYKSPTNDENAIEYVVDFIKKSIK